MTRVLVATGSSSHRRMLVGLLESDPDFQVVAQADDGVEAVELAARLEPDLVAMDLYLPGLNGIEATREIMARAPTRIVVLSPGEYGTDIGRGAEALRAGAIMVIPKPGEPTEPEFNERREIFLEMIKAASRKMAQPFVRSDEILEPPLVSWLRPLQFYVKPFSPGF